MIEPAKRNTMKSFKWPLLIAVLIIAASCVHHKNKSDALHQKRVLILGNSITQDGAYVDYLEYYLRKQYPKRALDIISIGLSSETVNGASEEAHPFPRPCIHDRLDSALHLIKPDLVLVCYGMNDGIFSNPDKGRFTAYKKGIIKLTTKVKAAGSDLILLTPTLFDPDPIKDRVSLEGEVHSYRRPYHNYNEVLDTFTDWLLSLEDEGIQIIDLHNYLRPILRKAKELKSDSTFIPDGIHPNAAGHFLMAKKILLDLYPEISMGDPYPTVLTLNSDPLFMLVRERRKLRSDGWLKYVGYTRGQTVKSNEIEITESSINDMDARIKKTNTLK